MAESTTWGIDGATADVDKMEMRKKVQAGSMYDGFVDAEIRSYNRSFRMDVGTEHDKTSIVTLQNAYYRVYSK